MSDTSSPIGVTVDTYWWDEKEEKFVPSNCVFVTAWAPISGSTGRGFEKTCCTPQELWDYMTALTEDKLKVLKDEFDYIPPAGSSPLPADLKELFK